MHNEPSIEQLEKLIKAFKDLGGSDAELSLLTEDVLHEFLPETNKSIDKIFSKKDHESISKIKDFKADPKHPVKEAIQATWKKKRVRYPIIFVSLFIIIFGILNLPLFIAQLQPVVPEKKYELVKEVVKPVMDKSAPLEPGEVIPGGNFLVIPKIGVNAPIVFVQSVDEKTVQDGLQNGVVHYAYTAKPGEEGNSFITGHSSNYWWNKGAFNYIFANLGRMAVGDQAKIYYNGNKYLYQVTEVKVVPPTDVSVLKQTATPTLTLMTCTPPGTSWQRLIIKLDQVSPLYKAPVVVQKYRELPNLSQLPNTNSNVFLDWVAKLLNL
ncbi:MAG: sortase [Patescibacteria group bacterium]|jgi:LPXTG-site transpeptidase (sortase) family protein|nr:sortase [Patescibacteria group bacterium]